MSLNRKRRIFRPSASPHRSRLPWRMLLASAGGLAAVLAAGWLFLVPSLPSARGSATTQIQAGAGQLAVLDAGTLRVGAQVVRLKGIAAPARGSICHGAQRMEFDCGSAAANALASLVRNASVDCAISGHDRQGRPIGDCQAAGHALSATLVRDGWASATEAELRGAETQARSAQLGIWHPLDQS